MFQVLSVFGLLSCVQVVAQIPIPMGGFDGHTVGSRSAPVQLEFFADLLCPDCKDAWPSMKEVMAHYGNDTLGFTLHTFPLPYHQHAFLASEGAVVMASKFPAQFWQYIDLIFDRQESFYNAVTEKETMVAVRASLANLVQAELGVPATGFLEGIADSTLNGDTRASWKYGCSRHVSGTPTFLVNGVPVAGQPAWGLKEWQWVLDPLVPASLQTQLSHKRPSRYSSSSLKAKSFNMLGAAGCPENTTECEYLPGTIVCCPPNEMCIRNVGCRC